VSVGAFKSILIRDCLHLLLLLCLSLAGGVALNAVRWHPLSWTYKTPELRLEETVTRMGALRNSALTFFPEVSLEEMKTICADHKALILDARPDFLYQAGHIPSALNLPRSNFKDRYSSMMNLLEGYRDKPVVVYCSSRECRESQRVAQAFKDLGYSRVMLFRGGWSEWYGAKLPVEKE
jgi:rhodanese-related sulfurtransferase